MPRIHRSLEVKKPRFGLWLVLTSACAPLPAGGASAASGVVRQVVNDNTRRLNTVGSFDRLADGTVTPIRDSPFAAGGVGTARGSRHKGLQLSSDGRYLLAVDAGSTTSQWCGSSPAVRCSESDAGLSPPTASTRAASPYTAIASTSPRQARRAAPTEPATPASRSTAAATSAGRLDRHAPRHVPPGRCAPQLRRPQARRGRRGDFADRQLHHRPWRTAHRRSRPPFAA
jgi:hypothetical protein